MRDVNLPQAADYADLDTYPIDRPGSARYQRLVDTCRDQIRSEGACLLKGFVVPDRLGRLVGDTEALLGAVHHNLNTNTTPYQTAVTDGEHGVHPTCRPGRSSVHVIAHDLIPSGHGFRLLYEWEPMRGFLSDVLELPSLYRYEDSLAGLNIAVNKRGDRNGWHFDQCDLVTSILIRPAAAGGLFQYCPNIRNAGDENYPGVQAVLDGDTEPVRTLDVESGDLAMFKGRHSMHRVTTIESDVPRLVALLGHDSHPGVVMTDEAKLRRFGRVA